MSAVVETSFSAPKMSGFLILNRGGRLTRTEQLTDCGLISLTYCFDLLIIRPEVKNKSYHISSIYRFGFLTVRPDFVL